MSASLVRRGLSAAQAAWSRLARRRMSAALARRGLSAAQARADLRELVRVWGSTSRLAAAMGVSEVSIRHQMNGVQPVTGLMCERLYGPGRGARLIHLGPDGRRVPRRWVGAATCEAAPAVDEAAACEAGPTPPDASAQAAPDPLGEALPCSAVVKDELTTAAPAPLPDPAPTGPAPAAREADAVDDAACIDGLVAWRGFYAAQAARARAEMEAIAARERRSAVLVEALDAALDALGVDAAARRRCEGPAVAFSYLATRRARPVPDVPSAAPKPRGRGARGAA